METFTQPKITGYRQLSETEAALMNEGKALAEQVAVYIDKSPCILTSCENLRQKIQTPHLTNVGSASA